MRIALILMTSAAWCMGCQSRTTPETQRDIDGFGKPGAPFVHGRLPASAVKKNELFVESKALNIEEKDSQSETGSLFAIDDQRNYLFTASAPFRVGQFIDVKVLPSQKTMDAAAEDSAKKESPDGADAKSPDSGDQFVKDMLAQLPELAPGEGESPTLLSKLRLKIEHVFSNGDVMAVLRRSSKQGPEQRDVYAKTRIPYDALASGEELTTQDLVDVRWTDSLDGNFTERYSSLWEDEYSLRLSGFKEARSAYARQLDEKKKQMEAMREKLNNQLVSLGKERKKNAEEREQTMKKKAETDARNQELEDQVKKQETELEQFRKDEEERKKAAALAESEAEASEEGPDAKEDTKAKPPAKPPAKAAK